jgi:hypothetical protein
MPISNSYPRGVPIEDQDLFVGTKANIYYIKNKN